MTGTRVPFFVRCRQIPLILIAIFSCALSFWLTVRFCGELSPGHASFELLAIGLVWELAKLTFGTLGAGQLARGPGPQRRMGCVLVGMSLVLALGSVVASLAFLRQTDRRLAEQALQTSEAYQRSTAHMAALEREMDTLAAVASQDAATQKYRARSLRTLERVAALRSERGRVAQARARLHAPRPREAGTQTASVPLALGGWVHAEALRACAQCVLAVMLELVSMLALALLLARHDTVHPDAALRSPYLVYANAPPRRVSPGPRTLCDASAEPYARAKALVGAAKLKPSYRAIQRALGISQPAALRFLRRMAAEGLLRHEGRSYALVHAKLAGGAA